MQIRRRARRSQGCVSGEGEERKWHVRPCYGFLIINSFQHYYEHPPAASPRQDTSLWPCLLLLLVTSPPQPDPSVMSSHTPILWFDINNAGTSRPSVLHNGRVMSVISRCLGMFELIFRVFLFVLVYVIDFFSLVFFYFYFLCWWWLCVYLLLFCFFCLFYFVSVLWKNVY